MEGKEREEGMGREGRDGKGGRKERGGREGENLAPQMFLSGLVPVNA